MIYIDRNLATPIYQQIYEALVSDIASGALKAGDKLMPSRKLAEDLAVGRNTVNKAYQQLLAEGYVQALQGSGITVNKMPSSLSEVPKAKKAKRKENVKEDFAYDFAYGPMDRNAFPFGVWRKCMNNAMDLMMLKSSLAYPPRTGEMELKEALASYLHRVRGVVASPEQIIITSGLQYNLDILALLFGDSKKRFGMENPGYDGVRPMFYNAGYDVIPIELDEEGISIEALKKEDLDLVYITPSHQFPTGAVLPIAKRLELLEWAEETDTYIIEDDYDSELRYYTNPIPSLQSLDNAGKVIYTGTFSKAFAPITRTAYLVLPMELLDKFQRLHGRYNSQLPVLHQLALADFVESGEYERNVNRLKTVYKKKESLFRELVDELFGDKIELNGGDAGIHFLMNVKTNLTADELINRAATIGVKVYSSEAEYLEGLYDELPYPQLVVGLPTVPMDAMRKILIGLRKVWDLE